MWDAPDPGRVAHAFPGVGAPFCGGEEAFFLRHESVMGPLLEQASRVADRDFREPLRTGRPPAGDEVVAQLFTTAFNGAVSAAWRSRGFPPAWVGGFSLGIYSALYAAGALPFGDALEATRRAYLAMQAACPPGAWDLAAVIGLDDPALRALLAGPGLASVRIVNAHNDTSKVLAGPRDELDSAVQRALEQGAFKALRLGVDLPYHHPELLREASTAFAPYLGTLSWSRPRCPVVSSIDQRLLDDPAELIDLTARNLSTPIHWQRVVEAFGAQGATTVLECGAGISLSQNARMIAGSPRFVSLKNWEQRLGP